VESRPPTPRQRLQAQRDAVGKRRKNSIGVGVTGLVLLFAGSIASLIFPGAILLLLVLMIAGLVLLVVALFLVRGQPSRLLKALEK